MDRWDVRDSSKGSDGKTVAKTGKYVCVWKKEADGKWKAIRDIWNYDWNYDGK